MSKTQRTIAFAVAVIVTCWPHEGQAGEAFVTRIRGTSLTIDKGAEEGLEVGLIVTVIRPPDEAIIHPLTGENLGAPAIELGTGEITKVSARAASIHLASSPILPVRPGDVVNYITPDEEMVMEQEMVTVTAEKAASERSSIRNKASGLARTIGAVQGTIKALQRSIKELRRFDNDVVKPQFNSINREMETIQAELKKLRESVTLMGSVAIDGLQGEGVEGELTDMQIEKLQQLIDEKLVMLQTQMPSGTAPGELPLLSDEEIPIDPEAEEEEEGGSLWIFIVVIVVGVLAIGFFVYMKMSAGGDDDEEDDEEDDEDGDFEDDDDEDLEIEEEDEEDDIVVEETQ
jgi:hypothetical protein